MNDAPAAPPPAGRAERLAWCGFDFANSAFTTLIVTATYPLFFKKVVVGDADRGETLWLWANAGSLLIVTLAAPVIGAWADVRAAKKRLLLATTAICVAATAGLSWCGPGAVLAACAVFVVANVAFSSGENLVAGFLPELAPPEELGRLSGLGWSLGYFGGLSALAIAFWMSTAGLARWIPVATAAFFALAATPTFLLLRERARPRAASGSIVKAAFAEAASAVAERRRFPDLFRLLSSLFFTQAGVATVIAFAGLYAQGEFGLADAEVQALFIALQLSAAAGAFISGRRQDRLGSRRALLEAIATWILAVLLAATAPTREVFYVAAALSGAAMGGSQAAGRAMVGLFTPPGREGAWFGLWGVATKAAAVVGIVSVALLLPHVGRRAAMSALVVFFALGALALFGVDEPRGRRAAREGAPT